MIVEEDRVPRVGFAVKVTVSPGSGFPFRVTRAVIVDVMVEPAATVDGLAESSSVPEATVMGVVWVWVAQLAVTIVLPGSDPGVNVMIAYP